MNSNSVARVPASLPKNGTVIPWQWSSVGGVKNAAQLDGPGLSGVYGCKPRLASSEEVTQAQRYRYVEWENWFDTIYWGVWWVHDLFSSCSTF